MCNKQMIQNGYDDDATTNTKESCQEACTATGKKNLHNTIKQWINHIESVKKKMAAFCYQ